MPKTKSKKKPEIPPDVMEAIEEAAIDIAAETNLSKAQAREMLVKRMQAKADASVEDVEGEAEAIEDEEDEDEGTGKSKKTSKKASKKTEDEEDEDEEDEEDEDEDEDEGDEKPPETHWSARPLFKRR